jgi:hypothetical protein
VTSFRVLYRHSPLAGFIYSVRQRSQYRQWERAGRPNPPPHIVKVMAVREYARRFGTRTLVETGTYFGDMLFATRDDFSRLYSIELDRGFCELARKRFAGRPHISILHGDSGDVLPDFLANVSEPCLFWLDGHYSGEGTARGELESPIMSELRAILSHREHGHVILVDDARCFVGEGGYPTVDELERWLASQAPDASVEVRDDIIRITRPVRPAGETHPPSRGG